mmetsp:Transcript_25994/g.53884  ORF Transcript_25994/g.53884 Transcript_25994/m.53884 type:complete len:333 (+) Transcript_25994:1002-2000(+)
MILLVLKLSDATRWSFFSNVSRSAFIATAIIGGINIPVLPRISLQICRGDRRLPDHRFLDLLPVVAWFGGHFSFLCRGTFLLRCNTLMLECRFVPPSTFVPRDQSLGVTGKVRTIATFIIRHHVFNTILSRMSSVTTTRLCGIFTPYLTHLFIFGITDSCPSHNAFPTLASINDCVVIITNENSLFRNLHRCTKGYLLLFHILLDPMALVISGEFEQNRVDKPRGTMIVKFVMVSYILAGDRVTHHLSTEQNDPLHGIHSRNIPVITTTTNTNTNTTIVTISNNIRLGRVHDRTLRSIRQGTFLHVRQLLGVCTFHSISPSSRHQMDQFTGR